MMKLYQYQEECVENIYAIWANDPKKNVLLVLPTGGGKTVIFSHIAKEQGKTLIMVHRKEIVVQISLAISRLGLKHRIIASEHTITTAQKMQFDEFKKVFMDFRAEIIVASVDTLARRPVDQMMLTTKLIICDEAHHVLKWNKWGRAIYRFKNAKVLGVTATPRRSDGFGLGRDNDGVFDEMVEGPTTSELMEMGSLTQYRLAVPTTRLDLSRVNVTNSGDYSHKSLGAELAKSEIVGDVVSTWKKLANGKLTLVFAVSVREGEKIANRFKSEGIPAAIVSAETDPYTRALMMRKFRCKELLVLVNVDIVGEGVDVPWIECVILARPTISLSLFLQQVGRGLRHVEGKDHVLIIDHVHNTQVHGLPDTPRIWSLDRNSDKKSKGDNGKTVKLCTECGLFYSKWLLACSHCGFNHIPESRTSIQAVDGDIHLLDASVLEKIKEETILRLKIPPHAAPAIRIRLEKIYRDLSEARYQLVNNMLLIGGKFMQEGLSEREAQKKFYIIFGIDVLTAQTLRLMGTNILNEKIITFLRGKQ